MKSGLEDMWVREGCGGEKGSSQAGVQDKTDNALLPARRVLAFTA
jgi:hypothetical protein